MVANEFKVARGTLAQYTAKKTSSQLDADTLYFLTDTNEIYLGQNKYCEPVEVVEDFPESGAQGKLYIHQTTFECKIWDGTEWVTISPSVSTAIEEGTPETNIATVGAIKAYVATASALAWQEIPTPSVG